MNSFTLIRGNMARKRLRSVLLMASITIAFFIFALLSSFEHGLNGTPSNNERLVVASKSGQSKALPISMAARFQQMPEVAQVTHLSKFRATYLDQRNFLGVNAVEPRSYAAYFADRYSFTEGQIAALEGNRIGVLIGQAFAQREGLKIGQRLVLTSPFERKADGTQDWALEIVGIFDGATLAEDTNFAVMRYDTYNAGRLYFRDTVANFGISPAPGFSADAVIAAIDGRFANSADETLTRTESAFMKAFIEQIADVATIVRLVVGAAFVTILMIVANTMFFAIRERAVEIAVLKVIGFSRGFILSVVLAETAWIFTIGLTMGLALAFVAGVVLSGPLSTIVPTMALTPSIVLQAAGLAMAFALLTGAIPALNAMRIPTTAALKGA